MIIIDVYIGNDNYVIKSNRPEEEITVGSTYPTEVFREWFENETENYYSTTEYDEMVVTTHELKYMSEF